jgi:hypothetical protein
MYPAGKGASLLALLPVLGTSQDICTLHRVGPRVVCGGSIERGTGLTVHVAKGEPRRSLGQAREDSAEPMWRPEKHVGQTGKDRGPSAAGRGRPGGRLQQSVLAGSPVRT